MKRFISETKAFYIVNHYGGFEKYEESTWGKDSRETLCYNEIGNHYLWLTINQVSFSAFAEVHLTDENGIIIKRDLWATYDEIPILITEELTGRKKRKGEKADE